MEKKCGKRQKNISDYFSRKPKQKKLEDKVAVQNQDNIEAESRINLAPSTSTSQCEVTIYNDKNTLENTENTLVAKANIPNDICNFINRRLTDTEVEEVLQNVWIPPSNFKFPVNRLQVQSKSKNLKFQYMWFSRWPWLVYSETENGAFCKYCCLFAKAGAGVNSQSLGALVKKKFDNWKHAVETFDKHSKLQYHLNCVSDADHFTEVSKNRTLSVENQVNTERKKQIIENRQNIEPIVEAIILCGKQDIALRGHRDFGSILGNHNLEHNDGNFRSIVRYRALGDKRLQEFLEGPGKRNKYISPVSQNAIIDSCNKVIVKKIVKKVNDSKCFSVLADETADISGIEQVSICVRYIDRESIVLREDFLQFVPTIDVSGKGLARLILDSLQSLGIDTSYLRGQGYDGAAAMSGHINGVQSHIKKHHPLAHYVHCSAHSLNLVVSKSCEVPSIRNCIGVIGKAHDFFIYPKRKNILNKRIESLEEDTHARTLKRNCATRWIERFHSVTDFIELLDPVLDALDEIAAEWTDVETVTNAKSLKFSIANGEFLISLLITAKLFSICLPLSKHFQKTNIDLKEAVGLASITFDELNEMRRNSEQYFKTIYEKTKSICEKLEVTLRIPRITKRQTHRSNPDLNLNTPEEYYRITVFNSFVDSFLLQLKERFINHKNLLNGFNSLFATSVNSEDQANFKNLMTIYEEDLTTCKDDALSEYNLWCRKIVSLEEKPLNAMDALRICNSEIYPNIFRLLQVLATLPVTNATSERSFSTLKRIKSYLRNSMTEVSFFKVTYNFLFVPTIYF